MKCTETSISSSKSNPLLALFLIAIFMILGLQLTKLNVVIKFGVCFFFSKEAWAINETITLTLFFTYYSSIKRPWFLSASTTPFCFNALPLFLHATTLCAYFSAPYGYESLELLPFAFSLFFQRNYIFPLHGIHFSISSSWCLVMLTLQ